MSGESTIVVPLQSILHHDRTPETRSTKTFIWYNLVWYTYIEMFRNILV